MRGRDQVVRALWRDLLPTAFLLTGDQAAAQHLVVRALVPGRRTATDHDTAVTALVRSQHRRWAAAGTGRITGDLPAPWWAAPADVAEARDLATRLDALDLDHRTAAVLRWYEQWDVDRTTALLPRVDLDALAGRLPPDLPRRLETLAGLGDPSALDDDTVVEAVRATTGRRVRRAVVGVVAATAIVAAGIWWPTQEPIPAAAPPDRGRPVAATPDPEGVLAAAPRGSLAVDPEFLEEVRRRVAAETVLTGDVRPLYGDDVQGVRVVLVSGSDGTQYWLTGPAGTPPADLTVSGFGFGTTDQTAMAVTATGSDGRVRLVVVTEDGTELTARPGLTIDPTTGTPTAISLDLPTTDGIAVTTLDRTWEIGVRLLAAQPGQSPIEVPTVPGGADGRSDTSMDDEAPGPASRSGNLVASDYAYASAVRTVSAATGWAPEDLQVTVLGDLDVPTSSGGTEEVVSIAAVLPGGGVVTSTGSGYLRRTANGTTGSWSDCGASAYPVGTDPDDLVVAATCMVSGPGYNGFDRVTVVFAPPGTAVELQTVDGTPVPVELVDGAGWSTYLGPQDLATATAGGITYPVAGSATTVFAY